MLFWRRKGKETKEMEKDMVPPKEEVRKETPRRVEPSAASQVAPTLPD